MGVGNTPWHPAQLLQDTLWVQLPYMEHGTLYRYFRQEVPDSAWPRSPSFHSLHASRYTATHSPSTWKARTRRILCRITLLSLLKGHTSSFVKLDLLYPARHTPNMAHPLWTSRLISGCHMGSSGAVTQSSRGRPGPGPSRMLRLSQQADPTATVSQPRGEPI